ncbi:MAG TPA: site-2 protease family protein [Actinomycetota bacterium]
MERRWKVASIAGIPIHITVPWLAFAALVIWATYQGLTATPVLTEREALAWSVGNAVLFYGSIVIHELAHAVTARAFHVPVLGITLVFWGGYTETDASARGPLSSFLISAAGPLSTLVLAGVFEIGSRVTEGVPAELLSNLAFLSLLFAGLNALPGFPVDGGRMLLAGVWGLTKDRYTATKVAGVGGIVVGGILGLLAILRLEDGDRSSDWIFFGFIGWMMISQGMQVVRQVPFLRRLAQGRVVEVMRPPPPSIEMSSTLLDALERHLRAAPSRLFPVVDGSGRLVGALDFDSAAKVGGRDPMRPVSDAMIPVSRLRTIGPDRTLDRAIEAMASGGQVLVVDEGRVIGGIAAEDVDRWLRREVSGQAGSPPEVIPPRPDIPDGGVGGSG